MTAVQSSPFQTITSSPARWPTTRIGCCSWVNVASWCGLTAWYDGLQALYARYQDQRFAVLGFPANDFPGAGARNEPGNSRVLPRNVLGDLPLFDKIAVTGSDKRPLYALLIDAAPHAKGDPAAHRERLRSFGIDANEDPEILWNFEKFLIGWDGTVLARFARTVTPDDPELLKAIESALASQRALWRATAAAARHKL
jgi:glutathione peroxidase